jgi:hypothetical protein
VHIAAHEQVAGQRLGCRMVDHLVDAQLDPAPMDSPTKPAADGLIAAARASGWPAYSARATRPGFSTRGRCRA